MSIPIPVLGAMIFVGIVIGVIYLAGLTKKWGILVPFAGMLLFGSMSLPLDWNNRVNPTVWLPIQRLRSELFIASGIAGLLVVFFQTYRLRDKNFSLSLWTLVLVGMYAALLRFAHDSPIQGLFSVIFAVCTLVPLGLTSMMVMEKIEDLVILLRTVILVNYAWVGMVVIQIAINPKFVTLGNESRFCGILGNPQHAGVLLAFCCVISIWLLLNDRKKFKVLYLGILGFNVVFLLWTGSRTGLGMTIIGLSAVLYTRVGRAILFLPILAILTYVGLKVVVNVIGIDFGLERLVSTTNTRDYAWWKLLTTGLENPLFGVGTLESEKSENSWLFGFAAYGLGMLAITLLFTLIAVWECLQLLRTRFWLPERYRPYSDLIMGTIAMYFAGAMLEGYMMARVGASLCIYVLVAGAGAMIRKYARQYHEGDLVEAQWEPNDYDSYEYEYKYDYGDEPSST